jgi:CubicO group peptidase (beta-lactamase class C family)
MSLVSAIDQIFVPAEQAIAEARIPCAALGLVRRGGERAVRFAGHAEFSPRRRRLEREMWFDLASLTKVIFTTQRLLELADEDLIDLDAPLARYIPDLRQYDLSAPERGLTLRQCLSHQTFLPAVAPLYTIGNDPDRLKAYVLQHAWSAGPAVYSDINFILLGIVIERVTGRSLVEEDLPKGLSFSPPKDMAVATEFCHWRNRVMVGDVHDENAYAFGGASGHAGLFGTIDGVLDYAHHLMNGGGLRPDTLQYILSPQTETRAIGWDIAHRGWHGGSGHSESTIGHLGFTGTGLWIDLEQGLAWTLLTNRVHPSRHTETGIMALRRDTGSLVASLTAK